MTHAEIVNKLIGPIRPVGESNTDAQRLENINEMCDLIEELTQQVMDVANDFKDSHEASVKEVQERANEFMIQNFA